MSARPQPVYFTAGFKGVKPSAVPVVSGSTVVPVGYGRRSNDTENLLRPELDKYHFKIWTNMFLKTQKTSCNPSSSPSLSQFSQIHKINTDLHQLSVPNTTLKTFFLLLNNI